MAPDAGPDPLEVAAAEGGPMPQGLSGSEQLLFLTLRSIYRDYRAGVINKEQARREKAEAVRVYKDNAFGERINAEMMDRIKRSEAVRHEIELGGCELCRKLVRTLDGRD